MSGATERMAPTLPQQLARNAAARGDQVALQEKRYGIWQSMTWDTYYARVRHVAQGIAELGLGRGDVLAVLGDSRPEWVIAELAAQSLGAASVGLYPDDGIEQIEYVLDHAEARIVVAENQEQVDKLLALGAQDRIRRVERIVYCDPRGLELYDDRILLDFEELARRGHQLDAERREWLDARIAAGDLEDVAILCTTSGTTAKPRLAMLTHRNLGWMSRTLMEIAPIESDDEVLSFLPLAWIGERMTAIACSLHKGFVLSFPENSSTMQVDLREIGPRMIVAPPLIWNQLVSSVQVRVEDAGWLKRTCFSWGLGVGRRAAQARLGGRGLGLRLRLARALADLVVLRAVRDQLGLARLRQAYTSGAPLGADVFGFLHAIGVNLKQIYGLTEICGVAVLHRDDAIRFNTVGTPLPQTELAIGPGNEILLRSPAVFKGYFRDPEATADALNDGWLHTGDAGCLEDGQLVVVDRVNDVTKAGDGTPFSPAFVENKLKFSPFVQEAVVFGERGADVTAMISIEMATVGAWAERNGLSYTSHADLAQKPQVYELIADAVARANYDLPGSLQVRRFVLLHKELDPDESELTRIRKVRRREISERYAAVIAALHDPSRYSVALRSAVSYKDGTTAEHSVDLRIHALNGRPADSELGLEAVLAEARRDPWGSSSS